jgi:hypothetical protein
MEKNQDSKVSNRLKVHYESDDLDLLQIGVLNKSLHNLLNHIAIAIVEIENEKAESRGEKRIVDTIPQTFTREDVLIRARLETIKIGSIELELQPYLAAIACSPHSIAILQNLVANAMWAIMEYAAKIPGISISKKSKGSNTSTLPGTSAKRRLSTKVNNLVKEIKESGHGGKLTIKSEDEELTIELYPPKK